MAIYQRSQRPKESSGAGRAWQRRLPVLSAATVGLRELRLGDAGSLRANLNGDAVRRHIASPPESVEGFRRFIEWSRRQRATGTHVSYGVVPEGEKAAVGVLQLWRVEPDFSTAEWGVAIGEAYWNTGVATAACRLLLEFAFETVGVHRLEARSGAANNRGSGLLAKLGAIREGTLRQAFVHGDTSEDQVMWSILAGDWSASRGPAAGLQADMGSRQ